MLLLFVSVVEKSHRNRAETFQLERRWAEETKTLGDGHRNDGDGRLRIDGVPSLQISDENAAAIPHAEIQRHQFEERQRERAREASDGAEIRHDAEDAQPEHEDKSSSCS